jgi:primosomal protein N' (replication factor Y)
MRDVFYNGIEIVKKLKRDLDNKSIILGPAVPVVRRINNRYICEIMIKYRELGNLNEVLSNIMNQNDKEDQFISIDRHLNVG